MNENTTKLKPSLGLEVIRNTIGKEYESARVTTAEARALLVQHQKRYIYCLVVWMSENPLILSYVAGSLYQCVLNANNAKRELKRINLKATFITAMPLEACGQEINTPTPDLHIPSSEQGPGPASMESLKEQEPVCHSGGAPRKLVGMFSEVNRSVQAVCSKLWQKSERFPKNGTNYPQMAG